MFQLTTPSEQRHLPMTVHTRRRKLTVCALCNQVTTGGLPCTAGLVCVACVTEHGPDKARGLAALRKESGT